jgi:hypothetical protein
LHELVSIVRAITPQDFQGEDMGKLVQQMQLADHFFEQNNHRPPDMITIMLKCVEKCTVPKYVGHFDTLKTIKSPILLNLADLFEEITRQYDEMIIDHSYTAHKHKVAFKAEHQRSNRDRDRRSSSKPPSSDASKDTEGRRSYRQPDITPPGPNQPHERVNADGKKEIWCTRDRCCIPKVEGKEYHRPGKWTTHEDTDAAHKKNWEFADQKKKEHKERLDKKKQGKGDRGIGGVAATPHPRPVITLSEPDDEPEAEPESETESEAAPGIVKPQPHQASWWATAYLN